VTASEVAILMLIAYELLSILMLDSSYKMVTSKVKLIASYELVTSGLTLTASTGSITLILTLDAMLMLQKLNSYSLTNALFFKIP